ncbi:MAG: class I SAM-dependent methyltransferase [Flavobacteriales bacterium]|nr:class I SAM-dependent methyltransferase [Flavobacteriales bacterium]MCB9166410.1 class I SAM-dependent methyltransferase [Flavobacteriales bacterium]
MPDISTVDPLTPVQAPCKHASCLICGSASIAGLLGYHGSKGLVRCRACGFVFMERIPTEQELNAYYSSYSYTTEGYLSPITVKRYQELLDEFEPYRKSGRLLDVGCGRGYFLIEARKRGWEVHGTEYSEAAIRLGERNGITMHAGKLGPDSFPEGVFDVVTSFEVMEHINNPLEDLAHIHRALRDGGLYYCTTPNFNSLLRYHLKDRYNIINYPEHLSYYTRSTLGRVLRTAGFRKRKVLTTGISLSRLKTSKGDKGEPLIAADSSDERLRQRIDSRWHMEVAKNLVNRLLSITGLGMSLKGYFEKP